MEHYKFFRPAALTRKYWNITKIQNNRVPGNAAPIRYRMSTFRHIIVNGEKILAVMIWTCFLILVPFFALRDKLQIISHQLTSFPRISIDCFNDTLVKVVQFPKVFKANKDRIQKLKTN